MGARQHHAILMHSKPLSLLERWSLNFNWPSPLSSRGALLRHPTLHCVLHSGRHRQNTAPSKHCMHRGPRCGAVQRGLWVGVSLRWFREKSGDTGKEWSLAWVRGMFAGEHAWTWSVPNPVCPVELTAAPAQESAPVGCCHLSTVWVNDNVDGHLEATWRQFLPCG